jgi:hypothetical protein
MLLISAIRSVLGLVFSRCAANSRDVAVFAPTLSGF